MSWLKKTLPVLILIVLVYSWYFLFYSKAHPTTLNIPEAKSSISLFIEPEAGKQPIIDAIRQAQKEVLVEVYILSDKDVIAALEETKSRGVSVNVILEQHPFGGGGLNPKTKTELTNHGVSVSWSNPSFALTHEKSIVIDDSEVFVLSQNLSESSFSKNREYDILDTDKTDVDEVRNIFLADWKRSSFTPTQTHLVVSPNTSRAGLTTLISGATKEIDIEIEDIADDMITNQLTEKAKTIPVNIIVPPLTSITSNKKDIDKLSSSGVNVKTLSSPYVHAKLILVDGVKAYVGSVNLSSQSMDENRELGIILSENDTVSNLVSTFSEDWNSATPVN